MLPKNLLCFSPLRWDYVMYRPQQLLLRFAEEANVYFFEEPVYDAEEASYLSFSTRSETLWKVVPHLISDLNPEEVTLSQARLLDEFLETAKLDNWMFLYYTAQALPFSAKHKPKLIIYDQVEQPGTGQDVNWDEVYAAVNAQIHQKLLFSNIVDLWH